MWWRRCGRKDVDYDNHYDNHYDNRYDNHYDNHYDNANYDQWLLVFYTNNYNHDDYKGIDYRWLG